MLVDDGWGVNGERISEIALGAVAVEVRRRWWKLTAAGELASSEVAPGNG